MRRLILTFLVTAALLYVALGAFLYLAQRSMLYLPDTTRYPPSAAGLADMQDVRFEAADGVLISGWYKKAPEGRPTILYFHGNGGNNLNHSGNARETIDNGYGLLILEYRGYGGNPGAPTEEGLYNDGRGAIAFLKVQGVAENDLVLFGYSLGTGVAIKMATEISPRGMILQAPYTSIADVAQSRYWYMPVKLLIKDPFPAAEIINRVTVPTLYQIATADRVIPARVSRALFEADEGPKTLEIYEGYSHHDFGNPDVVSTVFRFLDTLEERQQPQ